MSEQDSMSERELAEYLAETAYSTEPRSVGEALAAADAEQEPEPAAEPPIVVTDEPGEVDTGEDAIESELQEVPATEDVSEEEEGDIPEDENVAWAIKKYGDDPPKWAAAARAQEQHISRLAAEKKEAESLAGQWYEYAQGVESQAQMAQQAAMPLSSAEEEWIEQSLMNPYQAAQQAAYNGNVNLFNGVIARVAEENPMMAAQITSQIQREMEQYAMQEANGQPQPTLQESMGESIQRLGINLDVYGEPMSAKIGELGEHDPYVQTILSGEPQARDMALRAVYDLVRTGAMSTRKVRSDEREETIRREAELRRQAAGVVTGGPHQEQPPAQSPFMDAMEQEWKARGQWSDE